jgi:excisionase family DNA binding protein
MAKDRSDNFEPMLTIEDVADFCQVSSKTVRRWINAGDLPAAKLGAQWRIRPRDLDLLIRDRLTR